MLSKFLENAKSWHKHQLKERTIKTCFNQREKSHLHIRTFRHLYSCKSYSSLFFIRRKEGHAKTLEKFMEMCAYYNKTMYGFQIGYASKTCILTPFCYRMFKVFLCIGFCPSNFTRGKK